MNVNKTLYNVITSYDDDQLYYIMKSGIFLTEGIKLVYYGEPIGFKCVDMDSGSRGISPLCQNIERSLKKI